MIRKKIAIIFCMLISVLIFQDQVFGQSTTFSSGTAIIDMGSASPTVGNSLKPYGLVYALLKSKHVPINIVVNANKVKDGIDFVYNGKSYSGGTFIVSADYINSDITTLLTSWSNQGVLIDYTTSDLTVNVTYKINFIPKWVMDKANGGLAVSFLSAAGIPSSAYSFKLPSQLNSCDDIFILPHADPTWNSHNNLYFWNKNSKGAIWAGCHAVSALENLSRDTTIGGIPTTLKMNFLSTNGLLPFTDHNAASTPFTNFFPGDPVAQFYNKTDGAQLNGSETVYLPKIGSAWNTGAKIITSSPGQPDVPSLSPGVAVENIYGRAFDDATRGYVGYEASHNIGGTASTTADQIAAQRIFFNFSFFALNDKVPPVLTVTLSGIGNQLTAGTAAGLKATVTGTATGKTYVWTSSVAGTFSAPTSDSTNFTPSTSITSATTCIITCTVTESCGRVSFDSKKITVIPPPAGRTMLNKNISKSIPDGCISGSITFNVFDNNADPDAGARTLLSVTGLGNGTVLTSSNGDVTFTSSANFKGTTSGSFIVTNGAANSPSATITISIGDATLSPSLTTDAASVIVDNVTVINALANDKNTSSASLGDSLYIRDITTKPAKGFVYINVDGTLSYLSTKDQATVSGGDSFQYLACNTKGYCSVATVNITLIQDGCSAGQYQLTTTGTSTSTSFTPTIDSYITAGGSTNNGSATNLFLYGGGNTTSLIYTLIQFNLSSVTSTSTVNSAVLSLTANQNFTLGATTNSLNPASIYALSKVWTESGVTGLKFDGTNSWTANPLSSTSDYTTTNSGTITVANSSITSGSSVSSSSLVNMTQAWVTTSSNNNGLVIIPSSTTGSQIAGLQPRFHSNQSGTPSLVPKLFVSYTTPATCSTIPTTYKPIAYPDTSSTTSNTAKTISVKNNDANYYGNTNNVTAVTTPKNGTATFTSSSVTYTPSGSFVGTDTLTYTITDATNGQTSTATVRIIVSKVAPTIVRDNASTNSSTAVTINVGANDTDPQGSLTAPVITSLTKNGTATVSGTSIVYTPSAKFTGNDTLIYSRSGTAADACSSALSDTALVVITVLNQAPVAVNDSTTTFACVPVNIKIKTNDTDPEGDALTVTIVSNPSNGTITANTDGSYKYSPNTNYTGTDQFTYTVKDPAPLTSNTVTVKITISGGANPNIAPLAVADSDNTLVNQLVYTNVLANDSDPNSDPLTISVTASGLKAPSNGTIQLMANKLIKYTPNTDFAGTDTYEYQITDTHPGCSGNASLSTKALVTIKVKSVPILAGGTIWNDLDFSANETFNNIKTNSETGTNVNGSIYVYLTDSTNTVIDLTSADDAGVYQLSNVPSNTSKLNLVISTQILSLGGTLSTPVLPTGYVNTSPTVRVFSTGSTDITGYDFGIVASSVTGGTISSTSVAFCVSGTPVLISSAADATGFVSLQWQLSTTSGGSGFANITGATSSTYTPAGPITTTTWYRRKAIGSGSTYAYSNVLRLAVNPLPVITITPSITGVIPGTSATMTATGASTYTWAPATNLSSTTGSSVVVTPVAIGTIIYTITGTDANGCVNTVQTNVSGSVLPVAGAITGVCAVAKDSVKTYTVTATNATSYVWTLPNGWTGTSTTNSINAKATTTAGGTISVVPYNGSVAGVAVSFQVSVIDHAKVTLTGLPVTASGNNNSSITVTVTLYDASGNRINCSGGTAIVKFCENNPGTFTPVIDNNDGTYTTTVTASANTLDICGTVGGPPIVNKQRVTFTGPQGSIKGNGPILATEIPKLTFTMSAGRAPFTIIYKSAKSNKTDTLTNYTSGTVTGVTLIPSTTLYTLVSIIDANGERRDNNFTRDTATILVVAPRVVITLKADRTIADKDSTWITVLRVKTKNIGDLDLTSSQAKLDLSTVFPKPVTFVLDSITFAGTTITPNRNYNGISSSDLFARLSRPVNKMSVDVSQENNNVDVNSVTASPVSSVDGATDLFQKNIRVFTNPNKSGGEELEGEPVVIEEGNSIYMFGPLSYLPVGVEANMVLYLHVKPNGFTDPFVMQAVALGTGSTEGATALATSLSNDNNDIASHPEVTKQGDPVPTVVNLFPRAVIGASLTAGTPVLQGNGTYNVLLSYKLKNYGNLNLQSVQLSQNLLRSIGSPSTFSLVGSLITTGDLIVNPAFDAKIDTNMLSPNSILALNGEGTVKFTINITPNQLSSIYRLQALASGFNDQLNTAVTDLSTDGTDPDPDGNNIPSEKIKTIITINLTIPPLVPGTIAIQTGSTTVLAKSYCEKALGTDVIVPTSLNTGGTDPYEYQWQSAADNITFKDIVGATDSTYSTTTITSSVYVRRQVISGSQFTFSNAVYVQIYALPAKPVISGTATQVVGKGSVILTSTTATAYKWSGGDITRSITALTGGLYTVTITDANGCNSTSSVFTVTTLDPYKVADLQKVVSKAPVLQSDGSFVLGFTFLSSNLRGEVLDTVRIKDDLSKVFPSTVDYQVTQITASGKLKANVLYNGNSQLDLLSDVSQLPGLTTDSVQVYLRVNPNGFSGKLNNTAVLTATSPFGTFSVTSNDPTVGNGISVRNPTPFTIPIIDIFIPSGYSPNHDGVNDNFVIIRPFGTIINLEIFNRWGNAVYKAADYKNEWDGRGNQPNNILGQMLPDGTYYYIATATDKFTGTIRKFAGFVTLKR